MTTGDPRFLDAGMRVLARDGYAGLKQAAVCAETGLTTGAFYHSFRNWKEYEKALIAYWRTESTERLVQWVQEQPSPHDRVDALITVALGLPHRTEAAIRVWATFDDDVRTAQAEIDEVRRDAVTRNFVELGIDDDHADLLARTAMLLLIGHEAAGTTPALLGWSMRRFLTTDPDIRAALNAV